MTTYSSPSITYKLGIRQPSGFAGAPVEVHETISVAALATNDVINVCYLPRNAVVKSVALKAGAQLDTNGTPTLAFNVGVTGTAALFKSAITTVGRVSGASVDTTMTAAGYGYKNTSGGDLMVTVTASTGAATGAAGTIEVFVAYFLENASGRAA